MDAWIAKLKQREEMRLNPHLLIENGIVFTRGSNTENWKVIIPSDMAQVLTQETHEMYGHPGKYKTYHILKKLYTFAFTRA